MHSDRGGELLLAEIAASDGNPADRAQTLLQVLCRLVTLNAAWLGLDPMRSLVTASRWVPDATAGAVLHADGGCEPLPGLPGDELLSPRSALLPAAREPIDQGLIYSSFLWPRGGFHAPDGHVRVTVLKAPQDAPSRMLAVALLSPPADLHGLTPREFDVLGLLVEGCSNQEIARTLVVAQRTVATHLEHVLTKLDAPTRTLAAVRAERDGLYVPASARRRSCATRRGKSGAAQHRLSHGDQLYE